jgi:hypothetical protein
MSSIDYCEDEAIGIEQSAAAIKSMAGRQFVASLAVAVVIALGFGLTTLMPTPHHIAEAAVHRLALVQQPTFVAAPAQRVASARLAAVELP